MLELRTCSLLNQNIELFFTHDKKNADFVADYDDHTLLDAHSVWGHTWTFIYDITSHFPGNYGFKEQKLKKTLRNTYEKFKDAIQFMKKTHETIVERIKNGADEQLTEHRHIVVSISESLPCLFFPFRSFITELHEIKKGNAVFQKVSGKTLITQEDVEILEDFKNDYRIFALDGILQYKFPFKILLKLSTAEELLPEDDELLDRWLLAIKERVHILPVDVLHQAIFAAVHIFSKNEQLDHTQRLDLTSKIEWELFKKGCTLFDTPDPYHTTWVKSLIPTTVCDFENKAIIGKRIAFPALRKLGLYCFENQASSDEILLFGKNAAHLGIWKVYADEISWAIPCVKIIEIDKLGLFVRIEKIKQPLSEITWKTRHAGVKKEDILILDEISRLIAWLSCQRITPCDLKIEEVFFTNDDRLKVFAPLNQKKVSLFDFNALEQFALLVAKANRHSPNLHIFRYIMQQSKLIEHPVAKFYRYVVEQSLLLGKPLDISFEANLRLISDPQVILRAKNVIDDLMGLKDLFFDRLIDRFEAYDEEKKEILSHKIANTIYTMHIELGSCSTIAYDLTGRLEDFFSQSDSLSEGIERTHEIGFSKSLLQRYVPFLN